MYDENGNVAFDPLFCVPHLGTVGDREDPEKLGRVRLLVPGIYSQALSPWALPVGTLGGGSAQRGGFFVPEKGADVVVFFLLGDPERPMYLPGHWGRGEAPTALSGLSAQDTPNVRTIESKNFTVTFDDRSGSEQLVIKDKNNAAGVVRIAGGKVYGGDENASEPFVLGNQWKAGTEALFDQITAALDQIVLISVPTAVGPSGPPLNAAAFAAIKTQLIVLKGQLSAKLSSIIYGK